MPELQNSARKLLRATYTTVPNQNTEQKPGRAFPKHAAVSNVQISSSELDRLRRSQDIDAPTLHAIETAVHAKSRAMSLDAVALFAKVGSNSLVQAVETIAHIREQDLEDLRSLYQAITEANRLPTNLDFRATLEWAVAHRVREADASVLLQRISHDPAARKLVTYDQIESLSQARRDVAYNARAALERDFTISPVGFLHLERLNFLPASIEPGELVYSVPLSPAEEVNIAHKEWSNTSEEFSKIVTDYMEAFSEEGVAEKSELSKSTSAQEQHSFGFNTGVTASGGYGPVTITSSVGVNVSSSATSSEQVTRNHSSSLTRKASARSKQEHKSSFKVASAAGTEDQQVRRIRNPFLDKATRADYYQLVRKWQVNLYRYGIRLTYDVMIPEPGAGILSKIQEIQRINAALGEGFGDPNATQEWAKFNLDPDGISPDPAALATLEAMYGIAVNPPPAESLVQQKGTGAQKIGSDDDEVRFSSIDFAIPDGYVLDDLVVQTFTKDLYPGHDDAKFLFARNPAASDSLDPPDLTGLSGGLSVVFLMKHVREYVIQLLITAKRRPEFLTEWQTKAWETFREAAQTRYEANRQNLKQRLSTLLEELGAQDPLSLRKIEREEVMKGVLRWMIGPGFSFSLATDVLSAVDVPALPDNPISQFIASVAMGLVTAQEEIIRFLHQAIEWENMLYFLYPYFWSHSSRWELKKYLSHPDLMHRAFLKSGSARVVLTIRPGFEADLVSFLETGKVGSDHPYLTIAEEMQAYANTNYPGIRPANPEESARPLLTIMQRRAWDEMQKIIMVLEAYNRAQHVANPALDPTAKFYPTTAQGLGALAPLVPLVVNGKTQVAVLPLTDPWDHPYVYASPGVYNDFDLLSYGSDGLLGGEGEAADIASWAEASLIGQWYEYTPTSALDIRFNEILPSA